MNSQLDTGPPLACTAVLKEVMTGYYRELEQAARRGHPPVAWCTSQGPVELFRALGFLVYFPENHGALLGASRQAGDYIPRAVAQGFSPEVCSYLTSDIGAFLEGYTPLARAYGLAGLPRPQVLVYNNNQCREVQEWFRFYGHQYRVPVLGIHTPRGLGEVTPEVLEAVEAQTIRLIPALEEIAGTRFEPQRYRTVMALSARTTALWKGVLETARHSPAPFNFFHACIHIGPAVVLRGTPQAVAYYRMLLQELGDRVRKGIGAVRRERHRIYWEGMPIWGRLRLLSHKMAESGINVVASTYGHSWVFPAFDPRRPLESACRAYTELFTVRNEPVKEAFLEHMIRTYCVDGIIFHDARTCPSCTNSRYGLPARLTSRLGVPHLIINGDLNDLRCFSQEQTMTQLEAFAEQLDQTRAPQALRA